MNLIDFTPTQLKRLAALAKTTYGTLRHVAAGAPRDELRGRDPRRAGRQAHGQGRAPRVPERGLRVVRICQGMQESEVSKQPEATEAA